jgi:hypothetical protein
MLVIYQESLHDARSTECKTYSVSHYMVTLVNKGIQELSIITQHHSLLILRVLEGCM